MHNCADLNNLLNLHKMYFVYFGQWIPGEMIETIEDFYSLNWFYQSNTVCPGFDQGLYAIKGSADNGKITIKFDNDTIGIREFIKKNRFPQFVKITPGNFNYLLNSGSCDALHSLSIRFCRQMMNTNLFA